ncbi:mechanosensitive ion channel family protein [Chelativorans xinjiangense]|uniref:mechanosensitive ion channel family protein n=1 Tax=Chelativorans xinjiangense TaxID=2681485 RepID=UPI00135A5808|nr:mechanosensitive ion channel domain-containing protein [Chelativorans xinjiangense]
MEQPVEAPDLGGLANSLLGLLRQGFDQVTEPWFAYQLVIILILFASAKFLSRGVVPRLEDRARQIHGHRGFMRIAVALIHQADWIIFAALLFLALSVMRAVTWPSRSWLIAVVLSLSSAWIAASVLSRVIRNRLAARIVAWLVWVYAALVILGLDQPIAALLDSLALPLGDFRLSALVVLKSLLVLAAALWISVLAGNFLDERVQQTTDLTPSIRVLVGKVAKIGVILIAGAVALSTVGIDLTALTVFSGAIGLGLGFGLQKVVSNFISGIIILLDKSIKPGDTISLGETFGWIRELRARFVSVITRDGREYLIPNEDFITERVINWSFSDELVRLDVEFGVSYDADPHKVIELVIEAAAGVGRVEASRRPVCWLTGFGDSSLDFVLRFWIRDPQQGLTNIRGKVLLALWDAFKENGIQIPYPHREIIMKQPQKLPDGMAGLPAD